MIKNTIIYPQKKFCAFCGAPLAELPDHEGRLRKTCVGCGEITYANPIPATALIVPHPEDDSQILLVRRAVEPAYGELCLPGGFLEIDENPEQGALRELVEETGLNGTVRKLLGVYSQSSPQYRRVLLLGYLIAPTTGNVIAGDDALDANFYSITDLPPIAFDGHLHFVHLYAARTQ